MRLGAGLDFFRGFSLPWWFPRPGERAGRPGRDSLPKTLAVIGHPLLFFTGFRCFLERVLRVRQLCGPSHSCPPSSAPSVRRHFGHNCRCGSLWDGLEPK